MANEATRKDKEHKLQIEQLNAQNKELVISVEQLHEKMKQNEKGARGMIFFPVLNFEFM